MTATPAKTKTGFTPGPWFAEEPVGPGYLRIIGGLDGDAYDDGTPRQISTHVCDVIDNDDEIANARLVEAAPALLEALRDLKDVARGYLAQMDADDVLALEKAIAALKLADGA